MVVHVDLFWMESDERKGVNRGIGEHLGHCFGRGALATSRAYLIPTQPEDAARQGRSTWVYSTSTRTNLHHADELLGLFCR